MKLFVGILFLSLLYSCVNPDKNINIYQTPDSDIIIDAVDIIINEFDKNGIYDYKRMYEVVNSENLLDHTLSCPAKEHTLTIIFERGRWSEKDLDNCIFLSEYPGECCSGMFLYHTITVINRDFIYKSALAHELFHYFQKYIQGEQDNTTIETMHQPISLWKELVGFKSKKIGIINEALKRKGL